MIYYIDFYIMSTKITILKNLYEESACEKLLNGHILYTLFVLKIPTSNIYTQINIVKNAYNYKEILRLKEQYKKHNNLHRNKKNVQLFKDLCCVQFNIDNSITNTIEKVAKIPELYVHNEIVTKNVPHIVTKKCIYHKEIIKNISKENIHNKKKIKELLLIIKDKDRVIKNNQECIRRRKNFLNNLKVSKNAEKDIYYIILNIQLS